MSANGNQPNSAQKGENDMKFTIDMWDGDGFTNTAQLSTKTPTARKILEKFGFISADEHILLHVPDDGRLEEIPLDDEFKLQRSESSKFIAFQADRTFKFALNERRMPWGDATVSVANLRAITGTNDDLEFVLERKNKRDKKLDEADVISLDDPGLERVYTRQRSWKLKVQDVVLTILTPTIVVRDALVKAGLDPNAGWSAAIKYKNAPREAITLDGVIDLTRKGIEKLWLRPDQIQNGEVALEAKRSFSLRDEDEVYLNNSDLELETVVEGGRRWAILRGYRLPDGYSTEHADIAIEIPPTYPTAQLDMFYCFPHLALKSGRTIPQTQTSQSIEGRSYQRWSRHRHGTTKWNPETDSIITHLAIIADSIAREVGQ